MTVLKRRTLDDLAAQTKRTPESLALLLSQAGEHLADHFQEQDVKAGWADATPREVFGSPRGDVD